MDKKRLVSIVVLTSFLWSSNGLAGPEGGSVVVGGATISQNGNVTQINQSTDKAIIHWQSFDTNPSEAVQFFQPSSSSIALNRITSGLPTTFQGQLAANGHVWIVNPAGVLFTSTSKINVGGLLATTMDIKNSDFINGTYHFKTIPGFENSMVINNGEINTISDNGLVALVAPGVENNGIIRANVGRVVLASGNELTLDMYGDDLIHFAATPTTTASVSNNGYIEANNGHVLLTANAAENVVNNVVSMNGVIEAKSAVQNKNGVIILGGNGGVTKVSGKINSNKIVIKGHKTIIDGELNAGDKGFVETSGHYINLENMKLNMTNGTWLIDPWNFRVVSDNTVLFDYSQIHVSDITNVLDSNNDVILDAYTGSFIGGGADPGDVGDITIDAPIFSSGSGNFTAIAARNFNQNAEIAIGGNIYVNAEGDITLDGNIQVGNTASFNSISGDLFYNVPSATVPGGMSLVAANVYINSPIDIGGGLSTGINGASTTYINANIKTGGGFEVRDSAVIDTTQIESGSIQTYSNFVYLLSDVTMVGGIVLATGINGAHTLNINGDVMMNGMIGAEVPLAGINVSGQSLLNTVYIATSGEQNYQGGVILGANSDGNNNIMLEGNSINFGSTVDGGLTEAQTRAFLLMHDFNPEVIPFTFDSAINNNLNLQIVGSANFNGVVGNSTPLSSLDITGPTSINTSSLKTLNTQNYQGPVLVSQPSLLEGSVITFNDTVGRSDASLPFFINNESIPAGSAGRTYNGSANITFNSTSGATPLVDPTLFGQLETNTLEQSQCGVGDATCTAVENSEAIENESEGRIEVLVESPIPKTVAGTVFCMMGFATAIDSSGSERILLPGDKVYMNEKIVTDESTRVKIQYTTGRTVEVSSSQQYTINRVDSGGAREQI